MLAKWYIIAVYLCNQSSFFCFGFVFSSPENFWKVNRSKFYEAATPPNKDFDLDFDSPYFRVILIFIYYKKCVITRSE